MLDPLGSIEDWVNGLLEGVLNSAWGLVHAAFYSTGLTDAQWSAATFFTNRFVAVLASATVAVAAFQIIKLMIAGRSKEVLTPVVALVAAWPATATAVWLAVRTTGAVDRLVMAMLKSQSGPTAIETIYRTFAGAEDASSISGPTVDTNTTAQNIIVFALLALIVWLVSLVLTIVLEFRNFALLVLIAFAPVAWMLLPAETTRSWIRTWTQMTVGLILAKPVAAGMLMLSGELINATADDGWGAMLTGLVGIIVTSFSPAATLALVRFAGVSPAAEGDAAINSGLASTKRNASGAMRTTTRLLARR
ncbi:hypothetical protein ACTVBU_10915 [Sanguibacter sp. A246]|uniref:hypothetical protein n=1 Tax=Sanguibacter sp. A246 TaxID=3457326 RepID=UPI003FD73882